MSITVQHITKTYGAQKALDAVSLEVRPGEIVGFLGPNGAGKSTMMKIITGFLEPDSGEVEVKGLNIRQHPRKVKQHIGYLPENNPLYEELYMLEYLHFVAGLYPHSGNRKKNVEELVALTGLNDVRHKKIAALSKGYRQRVGIAQALVHDPDVLIMDEPTTGLDPNQIIEIRNLISTIGKEKTVMLSTHIMQEVEAVCDRVIIINNGQIVADAAAGDISHLAQGSGQQVLVRFRQAPALGAIRQAFPGAEVQTAENGRFVVSGSGGTDLREALFYYATKQDNPILELREEAHSLEQVFQQLTQ